MLPFQKGKSFCQLLQIWQNVKSVHMVGDAESDSDILHCHDKRTSCGQCDTELRCQLDTAASCNVLSVSDSETLGSPTMMPSSTTLTMYDGSKVQSKGRCHLNLRESGQVQTLMFEVVETKTLRSCLSTLVCNCS